MLPKFAAGLLLLVLTASCSVPVAGARKDYLSPDLRARVERLKKDTAATPTAADNVFRRTDVVWDWANAYALTGRAIPVDLPMIVTVVRFTEADGKRDIIPAGYEVPWDHVVGSIGRYIRELQVKDEQPDAIGSLRFASTAPLAARSWATVEEIYTVGSMPMAAGGAVAVGQLPLVDEGFFQQDDPAADTYVSIRCSKPGARFVPARVTLPGIYGGLRNARPLVAFRLEGAALVSGDTFTVTCGDRSKGSRGLLVQRFTTDRLLFPLYLDLEGKGNFFTPEWPRLEVIGQEPQRVAAFAPSVLRIGEKFDLTVRTEDRYQNRATGAIPGYRIVLEGKDLTSVPAGKSALQRVPDLAIDRAGVHRIEVRSEDGRLVCMANPIRVERQPETRVYWGETHGHTGYAEGQGSAEGYFRYGREDTRLDFLTLSEHDIWLDDFEWKTMQDLTRRFTEPGKFVAFAGYEWTTFRDRGGHHNVLFRTPGRKRVPVQTAGRPPELYRGLHRENKPEDVLVIPHAHLAGDWNQNDPAIQRLVEIHSMHGSFEWFGNKFLQNGFEVGFVAASDDHRAKPGAAPANFRPAALTPGGIAAVLAREKTPDSIFTAMRSLSTYATSGERILLDARLNGARMGTRQPDAPERRITCRASGTAPIDDISVIRNGKVIFTRNYLTADLAQHSWAQVSFESSSEVFTRETDNPRAYRIWEGTLEVEGARLVSVRPVGFKNIYAGRAEIDPQKPNTVRFRTETRGRKDSLLLELEGASASTAIRVRLDATKEYGGGPGFVRPYAAIPAADVRLGLDRLDRGRTDQALPVEQHTDRVALQLIRIDGPLDQQFEFADTSGTAAGDYYYVRVTQIDGGRAWSSPFWVGGKPNLDMLAKR
jgi:hypothetical protein